MNGDSMVFPYTQNRKDYLGVAPVLGVLILLEVLVLSLLIFFLVHQPVYQLILSGGLVLMVAIPVRVLTATLFTRHRLTTDSLHLHFGRVKLIIPREDIAELKAVQESLCGTEPLAARHDEERIVATFSETGQVALQLREPRMFKLGWGGPKRASAILFNVNQREAFLKEMGVLREPVAEEEPEVFQRVTRPVPIQNISHNQGLQCRNLMRRYGENRVVHDLNLNVAPCEIYGFLGCNGAGKTTTIKMIAGLLKPDGGSVFLNHQNMWEQPMAAKSLLGYVPDRAIFYGRLTGLEFLQFIGKMRDLPHAATEERIAQLLKRLDLTQKAHVLCDHYSLGMKRKISLAAGLLHRPEILVLDEPLNGLDPRSAHALKEMLGEEAASGTTILMSTHDLVTAETTCSRIGVMHGGKIVAEGTPQELKDLSANNNLETLFFELTAGGSL